VKGNSPDLESLNLAFQHVQDFEKPFFMLRIFIAILIALTSVNVFTT
jgi:hypothetical protein